VVTQFGRVLYFKTATSSTPLGQFSLIDVNISSDFDSQDLFHFFPQAKFDSVKENEVNIITESRVWELLFESEVLTSLPLPLHSSHLLVIGSKREKMEWMVILNRIVLDLESDGSIRSGESISSINFVKLHSWTSQKNQYWRSWTPFTKCFFDSEIHVSSWIPSSCW
jgi:hypothetical protein